ncbi:MAG: hypothetical protein H6R01_3 [Burkholderiaceae bacterium]|nr:hypothetical protein [Burkholderiaceae bacterium]
MKLRLLLAAALLIASNAFAAPPTTESVEQMFSLTKTESIMNTLYANLDNVMRSAINESLKGQKLTPKQQRALNALPARMAQVIREEFSWDKLKPVYLKIYQESFTQEEIDGLIAFYQSPAGVALVNKMPIVMQKSMAATQAQLAPMMAKMKAALDKAVAEIENECNE